MAADQPEQQPPPFRPPRYESSRPAGPTDSFGSDSSSGSFVQGCGEPSVPPGKEPQDDQDHVAALVAEARAQGPLPGPRPDPQQSHRPPLLPHLPDVERDEADAIIGRVLTESTGS